jgi:hypothetical protein
MGTTKAPPQEMKNLNFILKNQAPGQINLIRHNNLQYTVVVLGRINRIQQAINRVKGFRLRHIKHL